MFPIKTKSAFVKTKEFTAQLISFVVLKGLVLAPILLLVYLNNLADDLFTLARPFADET